MLRALPLAALLVSACSSDAPPVPSAETVAVAPAPPPAAAPTSAASSDTLVVVFFGDSLTAGYGLENPGRDAYPALVGRAFSDAGTPVRAVNAGSSGETTAGGLRRVDWVLARSVPDVFVLALGANDGLRGVDPAATAENLRAIFAKVRQAAPEARLVLAGMEALPNYGADYTARFRAVFPEVAREFDATLVPFLLDGVAGVAALNQADGVHPTAAGHRRMAEVVGETLGPVVASARAS